MGWEDPVEEEMESHSGILAWKIPWTEQPGGLQAMGLQRVSAERLSMHTRIICTYDINTTSQLTLGKKSSKRRKDPRYPGP